MKKKLQDEIENLKDIVKQMTVDFAEKMQTVQDELESNPYPEDIFPPVTSEELDRLNMLCLCKHSAII